MKYLGKMLAENRDSDLPTGKVRRDKAQKRYRDYIEAENRKKIKKFFDDAMVDITRMITDGSPCPSFTISTELFQMGLYLEDGFGEKKYDGIVKSFERTLTRAGLRMEVDHGHGDYDRDPEVAYTIYIFPLDKR